jgi:hypothetical protein
MGVHRIRAQVPAIAPEVNRERCNVSDQFDKNTGCIRPESALIGNGPIHAQHCLADHGPDGAANPQAVVIRGYPHCEHFGNRRVLWQSVRGQGNLAALSL